MPAVERLRAPVVQILGKPRRPPADLTPPVTDPFSVEGVKRDIPTFDQEPRCPWEATGVRQRAGHRFRTG
jgi:hypothetical protein